MQKRTGDDNANGDFLSLRTKPNNDRPFSFSCFKKGKAFKDTDDHDLFFEMDVTLPFYQESQASLYSNSVSQDFEFCMAFSSLKSTESCDISPADELFYKGHLLPLHLSSRLQMKEYMSSLAAGQNQYDRDLSSIKLSYYLQPDEMKNFSSTEAKDHVMNHIEHCNSVFLIPQSSSNDSGIFSDNDFEDKCPVKYRKNLQNIFFDNSMGIIQDPSEFPNCYKDPTLLCQTREMFESHVTKQEEMRSSGRLSRKLLSPVRTKKTTSGNCQRCDKSECIQRFTVSKDQKRLASFLNVRTPIVFLKSLVSRDSLKSFPKELVSNNHKVHDTWHHSMENHHSACCWELKNATNSEEPDNNRTVSKALDWLQRYWSSWKSTGIKLVSKRSEIVEHFQFPSSQVYPTLLGPNGERQILSQNLRATSFTKRSGDTKSAPSTRTRKAERMHEDSIKGNHCRSMSSTTMMEMERAIQGAIQHCKQSQGLTTSN